MEKGILFFSTKWCPSCKAVEPSIDQLLKEGVKIKKINCDYDASMTERYKVTNVPTFILTDMNGNELKRMVGGNKTKQQLKEWMG